MKYKSKGEEMMYEWYIQTHLTNPAIHIEKEYDFYKLGCPRHLKSDFLIFYNEIPVSDIEVHGEQHFTDPKVIERDNYKQEWLNDNHIDYIYAKYKTGCFLNFSDWYYEQWHGGFGDELGDADYPTYIEDWWHSTVFDHVLFCYNHGINLYTAYRDPDKYPICGLEE